MSAVPPRNGLTAPTAAELYRRWERQHWAAWDLDLRRDREQWLAASDGQRRHWRRLGWFEHFRLIESLAVNTMAAYVDAAPREEHRLYLATQAADEARHTVFFDRFCREVLGEAAPGPTAAGVTASAELRRLFGEAPRAAVAKVLAEPGNLTALAEAITLSHLVLEGTLATSGMCVVLATFRRLDVFPGLRRGLSAVLRDESRHVLFGLRFLQEAVRESPAVGPAVLGVIDGLLPAWRRVLEVAPDRRALFVALGLEPERRRLLAEGLLRRHLTALGLQLLVGGRAAA